MVIYLWQTAPCLQDTRIRTGLFTTPTIQCCWSDLFADVHKCHKDEFLADVVINLVSHDNFGCDKVVTWLAALVI